MALSDILERIRDDAGRKADGLREQSRREAEEIVAEARREAEKTESAIVERSAKKLHEEVERDLSQARLEIRKEVLALKRKLIAAVLEGIPDLLLEKPAAEYAVLLAGFVDGDALSVPAVLQVGTREVERYGSGFSGLLAGILKEKYPGIPLEPLPEPGAFDQGVVIRAEKVEHNLSFDSLLAKARPWAEAEAAGILFSS